MRLLRLSTLAIAALLACARDHDFGPMRAGWRPLMQTPEIRAGVDTNTIVRSMSGTDVWLGFDYARPDPLPGDTTGKTISRSEAHLRVDCGGRRARALHLRVYDGAGTRLDEMAFAEGQGEGAWRAFDAHPLGTIIFDSLCVALPGAPVRDA